MLEQERTRSREPEAAGNKYERTMRLRDGWMDKAMNGQVLVRGEEREYELNRQGRIRYYLQPQHYPEMALADWVIFINHIQRQSGKHRHQGGLVIFVLEGEGVTDFDGVRVDWKAGDLLLLPVKPQGVAHQHFNKDLEKGCRWMAFIYEPFAHYVMDHIVQLEDMPTDEEPSVTATRLSRLALPTTEGQGAAIEADGYEPLKVTHPGQLAETDLTSELFRIRDHQRHLHRNASWFIQGDRIPWQTTPQGIIRWYMHPALEYVGLRTMLFYVQHIPGGSRSGRQRHSGNAVFYALEGRGHTVLDGVTYQWGAGDMVLLPNRPNGVVYQHFNDDPSTPVYLVSAEPNLMQTIDLDRGAGFEQLEPCPEYRTPEVAANGKSHT